MNIFKLAKPSGATAEGWDEWHTKARVAHPIKYFLSETLPLRLRIWHERYWNRPLYWLRTHTVNKYHLVDMRCPKNGYKWGWIDRSEAFLYANFALLVDFVEKEYPGCIDWEWNEDIRVTRDEFLALYKWWKEERAAEREALNAETTKLFGKSLGESSVSPEVTAARAALYAKDEAFDKKDDEMLCRLIAVRHVLWT